MKRLIFLIVAVVEMLAISGCGREKVYTVTIDANGGTGKMKEQIFVKDVAQTLVSNAFVRELYSFVGWNTVPDGSGVAYSDAQEVSLKQDITLYAQWDVAAYRITFDANGGTGSMAPMTIGKNEVKVLPENAFTRSGYIFYGWATSANGEVAYSNKASIEEVREDLTLYALWTKPEGGRQAVDLGLPSGLKWASCNVGADNPEEYGDNFAWGETETKTEYSIRTYVHCNGTYNTLTKYNYNPDYGVVDNIMVLESIDDAATVNWGDNWRMPTYEEMKELLDSCIWIFTSYNGQRGNVVIGPNRKSIFLPNAGVYCDDTFYGGDGRRGHYWTSTLGTDQPWDTWYLDAPSESHYLQDDFNYRRCGLSVRPVCQ